MPTQETKSRRGIKRGPNRIAREAREFAREFVESEEYRESLIDRIRLHDLPPQVEVMLWMYAYGRPSDKVQPEHDARDLARLATSELFEKAQALMDQVRELETRQSHEERRALPPSRILEGELVS